MQSEKGYMKYEFDDLNYDPCEASDDITANDLNTLKKQKETGGKQLLDEEDEEEEEEKNALQGRAEDDGIFLYRREENAKDGTQNKKRNCKKVRTNPFFVDRFNISANLPPPPPHPPPQFFPPVEEEDTKPKICLRRKKKCKKKKDFGNVFEVEEENGERTGEDDGEGGGKGSGLDLGDNFGDGRDGDGICGGICDDDDGGKRRGRRKCGKPQDRPPCRKVSDVSISLLPRQIPARQRDLPATSPLTLPEVERQIMISCKEYCQRDCVGAKRKCKKKLE